MLTRRSARRSVAAASVAGLVAVTVAVGLGPPGAAGPLPGAPACPRFPADSFWHADVSALPVHPQSATWVASVGATAKLKADFGSGTWDGGPIGIPFTTVGAGQPPVPVSFDYAAESDPGPYPIPPDAPIEGGPASDGDRHVLVVDRDACRLWELYAAYPHEGGASWSAGSGATWDLRSNAMRPLGWTSADAAGLPILPGLVRHDEVAGGEIDHAIRFTAPRTADAYVWPASHKARTGGPSDPPMGAWFRLKGDYDISGFSAANQVILRALKRHGMVLADNGSPWFLSGAPDPGWDDDDLHRLRSVPGSAFEAVDVSSLPVSPTSYAVAGSGPGGSPTKTTSPRGSKTTTTVPPTTVPPATTTTATPGTTSPTTVPPGGANLVANGGFESGLAGWEPGDAQTTLARTCTTAYEGACSAEIGHRAGSGKVLVDDVPDSVGASDAGATYAAAAWVRAPAGQRILLRVTEHAGGTLVRAAQSSATATGAWQLVTVTGPPAQGGTSIGLSLLLSLPGGATAHVDAVSLERR